MLHSAVGVETMPDSLTRETIGQTVLRLRDEPVVHRQNETWVPTPAVITAMEELVALVAEVRSPEGGWPADRPPTAENITPYVLDEAYDLQVALQHSHQPDQQAPWDPFHCLQRLFQRRLLVVDAIPHLLWTIARSSPQAMKLLAGLRAEVFQPGQTWDRGVLRLVALLELRTPHLHWTLDLATLDPPPSELHTNTLVRWTDRSIHWVEGFLQGLQDQVQSCTPLVRPLLQTPTAVEVLVPGQSWETGFLQLHLQLTFQPDTLYLPVVPVSPLTQPTVLETIVKCIEGTRWDSQGNRSLQPGDDRSPDFTPAPIDPDPMARDSVTRNPITGDGTTGDPRFGADRQPTPAGSNTETAPPNRSSVSSATAPPPDRSNSRPSNSRSSDSPSATTVDFTLDLPAPIPQRAVAAVLAPPVSTVETDADLDPALSLPRRPQAASLEEPEALRSDRAADSSPEVALDAEPPAPIAQTSETVADLFSDLFGTGSDNESQADGAQKDGSRQDGSRQDGSPANEFPTQEFQTGGYPTNESQADESPIDGSHADGSPDNGSPATTSQANEPSANAFPTNEFLADRNPSRPPSTTTLSLTPDLFPAPDTGTEPTTALNLFGDEDPGEPETVVDPEAPTVPAPQQPFPIDRRNTVAPDPNSPPAVTAASEAELSLTLEGFGDLFMDLPEADPQVPAALLSPTPAPDSQPPEPQTPVSTAPGFSPATQSVNRTANRTANRMSGRGSIESAPAIDADLPPVTDPGVLSYPTATNFLDFLPSREDPEPAVNLESQLEPQEDLEPAVNPEPTTDPDPATNSPAAIGTGTDISGAGAPLSEASTANDLFPTWDDPGPGAVTPQPSLDRTPDHPDVLQADPQADPQELDQVASPTTDSTPMESAADSAFDRADVATADDRLPLESGDSTPTPETILEVVPLDRDSADGSEITPVIHDADGVLLDKIYLDLASVPPNPPRPCLIHKQFQQAQTQDWGPEFWDLEDGDSETRLPALVNLACDILEPPLATQTLVDWGFLPAETDLENFALQLLWQLIHHSYPLTCLLSGVPGQILQPQWGWENGMISLVPLLRLQSDNLRLDLDLTSGSPVRVETLLIAPDILLQTNTPEWPQVRETVGQFQGELQHTMQQVIPELQLLFEGMGVRFHTHNQPWHLGQLQLRLELSFQGRWPQSSGGANDGLRERPPSWR